MKHSLGLPWRAGLRAAALWACLASAAGAMTLGESLDLTLSLRSDVWSGTRTLDDERGVARASAWARARLDLGASGTLVADGWLAAQHPRAEGQPTGRLRELFWQGSAGPLRWKLGRQMMVWGRADGLNPTDQLSPRDFTLLVPTDNDQRRGNTAARMDLDVGAGTLTALWAPRGAGHTVPLQATPGVQFDTERSPRRDQWALKLDLAGEGIDGSVSAFSGTDPWPDLRLDTEALGTTPGVHVALRQAPLRMLGADISLTRGTAVWRAEAAWLRSGGGPDDFGRKRDRLWLVAGGEWPLAEGITLGLQASVQHLRGFRSPDTIAAAPGTGAAGDAVAALAREVAWRQAALNNQTTRNQQGLVGRLAGRWLNDRLLGEVSAVWLNGPSSLLWRSRMSWSVDDRLVIEAGTDHYSGPARSLWGQLRDDRVAFVQARWGL